MPINASWRMSVRCTTKFWGRIPCCGPKRTRARPKGILFHLWKVGDQSSLSLSEFYINPTDGRAHAGAQLNRKAASDGGYKTLATDVNWSVDVNGWFGLNVTSGGIVTKNDPVVASLTLKLNGLSYDVTPASEIVKKTQACQVQAMRWSSSYVGLPAELGGDTEPVVALIYPVNETIQPEAGSSVNEVRCPNMSCVDLRALDDTYAQPNRVWKLPDIHLTGTTGTVVYQTEGALQVFSDDHPSTGEFADGSTRPGWSGLSCTRLRRRGIGRFRRLEHALQSGVGSVERSGCAASRRSHLDPQRR